MGERFIEAGKKKNLDVKLFSYELSPYVPVSAIAKIIIGKKWTAPDIKQHLKEVVKEYKIGIIVPFVDPATVLAAELRKELEDVFIPVSNPGSTALFFNKIKADDWFRKNSFSIPSDDGSFPKIAKPAEGSASQGLIIIRDEDEWKEFYDNHSGGKYLVQKFIEEGIEYTVDCYVSETGKILAVVPRIRLEVSGGEATKTVTVREEEIISLSEKILKAAELKGPVTIQFIRSRQTQKLYVMEINPRFGGGCIAAIEAGADLPAMLLNDFLALPNEPVTNWQVNLLMMRANREFFKVITDSDLRGSFA